MNNHQAAVSAQRIIPIAPAGTSAAASAPAGSACASTEEVFALMVLGDSMQPEFAEGDIVIVEPDGLLQDGSYVIAHSGDEWLLRQLRQHAGQWWLHAHDRRLDDVPCPDLQAIRGVVIQKRIAGRRRNSKSYVERP
jgi:SOS-response transcriptional repressor LexA